MKINTPWKFAYNAFGENTTTYKYYKCLDILHIITMFIDNEISSKSSLADINQIVEYNAHNTSHLDIDEVDFESITNHFRDYIKLLENS
jgi:hypothetical protein